MQKRLLLGADGFHGKEISVFDNVRGFRKVLNNRAWSILKLLSRREMYAAETAKELGMSVQKAYYHFRNLEKVGLIQRVGDVDVKGARAKLYKATTPAFGFEYGAEEVLPPSYLSMGAGLRDFLKPVIMDGSLNGMIVVGSPDPHGPLKRVGRDGHYATQLGLFLGQYLRYPGEFIVKLDVDVKAEKKESENMILIGGPASNLMTSEVNKGLLISFSESNYWAGLLSQKGTYSSDSCGVIAKTLNPHDRRNKVIVCAGIRAVGTKAAIIALTNFHQKVFKEYLGQDEWACVVEGFDLDGDGKIDSIDVLEHS